jgi:hypothetical protein
LNTKHVAKIAETAALSATEAHSECQASSEEEAHEDDELPDWKPKRLVRTVVSSMACSRDFGRQVAREARRRRFCQATAGAFLGDGLPWNWSIWKEHFPTFTAILDFTHTLTYLFLAAKAVHAEDEATAWSQYVVWMTGCWRGEVDQVLDELAVWQQRLGGPPTDAAETDPRQVIAKTHQYFTNNRSRMDYPTYRRAGLPVTTAWMESLVKEMNYRVKGTEMFWNDPAGAEAILQVRAASLSDDERLIRHLRMRPGSPHPRRPKLPALTSGNDKS